MLSVKRNIDSSFSSFTLILTTCKSLWAVGFGFKVVRFLIQKSIDLAFVVTKSVWQGSQALPPSNWSFSVNSKLLHYRVVVDVVELVLL